MTAAKYDIPQGDAVINRALRGAGIPHHSGHWVAEVALGIACSNDRNFKLKVQE